ncbi:MAG: CvpA family protein [Pseudomonadales bacterium]
MTIASSLLFIVVVFFSIRGFFRGFPGVVARLLGFILGYVMATVYRNSLATFIAERTTIDLPPQVLQIASSAILFFATLFSVGLIVTGIFSLLTKIIPASQGLLDGKSTISRIFGALSNGFIGAAMVLIALWGYGLVSNNTEPPDTLQTIANTFGDSMLSLVSKTADLITNNSDNSPARKKYPSHTTTAHQSPVIVETGSAEIISASNPDKRISIKTITKLVEQLNPRTDTATDLDQRLKSEKVQDLLSDPAIRKMALEQLKNNPDQIMEALNNPKFRELLEQMGNN